MFVPSYACDFMLVEVNDDVSLHSDDIYGLDVNMTMRENLVMGLILGLMKMAW